MTRMVGELHVILPSFAKARITDDDDDDDGEDDEDEDDNEEEEDDGDDDDDLLWESIGLSSCHHLQSLKLIMTPSNMQQQGLPYQLGFVAFRYLLNLLLETSRGLDCLVIKFGILGFPLVALAEEFDWERLAMTIGSFNSLKQADFVLILDCDIDDLNNVTSVEDVRNQCTEFLLSTALGPLMKEGRICTRFEYSDDFVNAISHKSCM